MSTFGGSISGDEIEAAVHDLIVQWAPTYLHDRERRLGRPVGSLAKLHAYPTANALYKPNGYKGPGFVVISTGLAAEPEKHGKGGPGGFSYRAWWAFNVAVIVSAKDHASTNTNLKAYAAAVRALIVEHPSLDGLAEDTRWLDESYDDIDVERTRTFAVAELMFRTLIEDAQTITAGPLSGQPDPAGGGGSTPDPGDVPQPGDVGDWPTVTDVEVDVNAAPTNP